jgi:hypothetical protein
VDENMLSGKTGINGLDLWRRRQRRQTHYNLECHVLEHLIKQKDLRNYHHEREKLIFLV